MTKQSSAECNDRNNDRPSFTFISIARCLCKCPSPSLPTSPLWYEVFLDEVFQGDMKSSFCPRLTENCIGLAVKSVATWSWSLIGENRPHLWLNSSSSFDNDVFCSTIVVQVGIIGRILFTVALSYLTPNQVFLDMASRDNIRIVETEFGPCHLQSPSLNSRTWTNLQSLEEALANPSFSDVWRQQCSKMYNGSNGMNPEIWGCMKV